MRSVDVTIRTALTVGECAEVFRESAGSLRGAAAKFGELAMKVGGHKAEFGFFTPTDDSPFAAVTEQPDFRIGFLFGSGLGAGGRPGAIHMYVYDQGENRRVELSSPYGMGGRSRSEKIVGEVVDGFRAADRTARAI